MLLIFLEKSMKKTFFIILALSVYLFANQDVVIKQILNNLKSKYASDSRVSVFNYTINSSTDTIKINLEIEKELEIVTVLLVDSLKQYKITNYELQIEKLPNVDLNNKFFGVVTLSVANGRAKPSHASEMVTQALLGTPAKVLKKSVNGDWYFVKLPDNYLCWIEDESITLMDSTEFYKWCSLPKIIFLPEYGHCYEKPKINSYYVSDLVVGNILSIIGEQNNFVKVLFPDGREAFIKKNETKRLEEWVKESKITAENLIKTGKRFLGQPYLWGGTSSKGLDCSGFVKTTFFINGVILQRDASQQALYGAEINDITDISEDFNKLEPGDLLFWGRKPSNIVTHVGMYIGNGKYIHSSGKVKINSFDSRDKIFLQRLVKIFIKAKRYIGNVGSEGIEPITNNYLFQYYFKK